MTLYSLFTPEMIILLATVFAGLIFIFLITNRDFTQGIYIWLLSVLFFKYMKINMSGLILPDISLERILFVILVTMFIFEVLVNKRRLFSPTGIEYSMLLFLLAAILSMIFKGVILKEYERLQIGELLTGYIYPFVIFFVSKNVYDTAYKREGFIKFIILIGLYLSFTAIFEHFRISELVFPRYIMDPSFGIHFGRARGPFAMAAANGTVLGFVFLSCFYFLFNYKGISLWKSCSSILLILTPVALFFTYTRGPWVACLLGFIVLLVFSKSNRKKILLLAFILLCIAGLLCLFFTLDRDTADNIYMRIHEKEPIYDRLNLYTAYINMFMEHPFFGIGFGRFLTYVEDYIVNTYGKYSFPLSGIAIHDSFTGILAEMGLSGLILILTVYFLILSKAIKLYKRFAASERDNSVFVVVFLGFMTVYLVNSIFTGMRYFEFVNSLFFIFAGAICRMEK